MAGMLSHLPLCLKITFTFKKLEVSVLLKLQQKVLILYQIITV